MTRRTIKSFGFLIRLALPVFAFVAILSGAALADCSTDSPPTCFYIPAGQTLVVNLQAFTVTGGGSSCHVVSTCQADVMVPAGSQAEWSSFLDSALVTGANACLTVSGC